jgi:murein DD-endopeptidase MepM/ murein hydrolase activator NlpD
LADEVNNEATDKEEKKENPKSTVRQGFHMMLFVDSKDGMIKQMGIGQRVIEVTLASIAALIIVLAVGWGISAYHGAASDRENAELKEQAQDLTAKNDALTETNDELNKKIDALSSTVNIKVKNEKQAAKEDESAHEPTGFPLSASAATPETGSNNMVIYTAAAGTNVIAAGDGTVTQILPDADYGQVITVDHGNGYKSMYYNNGKAMVKKGDKVVRGSVLFSIDDSSTKLGYQISKDDKLVDPMTLTVIDG